MTDFKEINNAWWNWYYSDEKGNERNKTSKERKNFHKLLEEGVEKFIFNKKEWVRISSSYLSNSGKSSDKTVVFKSSDGEKISKDSIFKDNRKNTFLDRDKS